MNKELVGKIYQTTNYGMFKVMKGNRDVKEVNVRRILKSIEKRGQIQPILVNEVYEVADGQTRLAVAQRLNKPIQYTVKPGIEADTVSEINNMTNKWKPFDYAKSFSELGNDNYEKYEDFLAEFPDFSHSTAVLLLSGTDSRNQTAEKKFSTGEFVVKSYARAVKTGKFLMKIAPYYQGFNRRSFVLAILKVIAHPEFSEERLFRKLSKTTMLRDLPKIEDYVKELERLYNWKETNKLRFY